MDQSPKTGENSELSWKIKELVGGLGFEPRLAESESAVLPLDDPPNASPTISP